MKTAVRNGLIGSAALAVILAATGIYWWMHSTADTAQPTATSMVVEVPVETVPAPQPAPVESTPPAETPPAHTSSSHTTSAGGVHFPGSPITGGVPMTTNPHAGATGSPHPTTASPQSGAPPSSSIELSDKSFSELDWGQTAFNAPKQMQYAKPQVLELVVSPTMTTDELENELGSRVGVVSDRIQISNRMAARLTGNGASIQALTPELQAVTSGTPTRWRWEVIPTDTDSADLHLSLSALVDIAGNNTEKAIQSIDTHIIVDITMGQRVSGFMKNNWQWLWAAILVPAGGFFWNFRKKRTPRPS